MLELGRADNAVKCELPLCQGCDVYIVSRDVLWKWKETYLRRV